MYIERCKDLPFYAGVKELTHLLVSLQQHTFIRVAWLGAVAIRHSSSKIQNAVKQKVWPLISGKR